MAKKTILPAKFKKYLEKAGIKHNILEHKTVYTAFDAAATMRKKLSEIAKTLLVAADKNYYLVILPADHNLDFKKLAKLIGVKAKKEIKAVKIPNEKIMEKLLKVKAGALSSFGGFHNLPVLVEKNLAKAKKAVFSSGSFNHSIEAMVNDFVKLENAALGSFGVKRKIIVVKKSKTRVKADKNKKTNRK
jgi:Cys-tRNA(Pro)/Cys-tRNA(Cys) deacylase